MHGMHRHGVTHFDERPAAVESSKGKRRAVLPWCLWRWQW